MSVDTSKLGLTVAQMMEVIESNHHRVSEGEEVIIEDVAILVKLVDEEGDETWAIKFTQKDLDKKIGFLERAKAIVLLP